MKILVVGASGATGRHVVTQLLNTRNTIKVIVRPTSRIPDEWQNDQNVTIIKALISELPTEEMATHLSDCQAVVSCLGHNLTLKGIYGNPRKLVTNAVKLLCNAIESIEPEKSVKLILMNTTGNRNRDLNETVSIGQRIILGIIRVLLPPQPDNEKAAEYLRVEIGQGHPAIEWVAVRPDSLINDEKVSEYELHPSPIRSALFNPGKTSRINVGHFMSSLINDQELWNSWKGQMPVIYNKE